MDIVFSSTTQLAAAIRAGHVSSIEVLKAHLAQIDAHNPALKAVVTMDAERAYERAREADAALARGEVWGPLVIARAISEVTGPFQRQRATNSRRREIIHEHKNMFDTIWLRSVARGEPACPKHHLRAELPAYADQICKQEAGIFGG